MEGPGDAEIRIEGGENHQTAPVADAVANEGEKYDGGGDSESEGGFSNEEVGGNEETDSGEVAISPNKFCVDYAKRGTAKCRRCKKGIEKNLLRIGKYTTFQGKLITQYFHLTCAFSMFENARLAENTVKDTSEIDGTEKISEKDQALLIEEIKKLNEKRQHINHVIAKKTCKTRKQVTASANQQEQKS